MNNDDKNQLLEKEFLKLLSARQGHFKLESGHHGNLWLDLDVLFLRPGKLRPFVTELARVISTHNASAICGPLVGGGLIAHEIASELDGEFYFAERLPFRENNGSHSVRYQIPEALRETLRGKSVAVIDDVINAGSATRATLAGLRDCGATVALVGALLILGNSMPKFLMGHNLPYTSIAAIPNEIWLPSECPLCEKKIPIESITR